MEIAALVFEMQRVGDGDAEAMGRHRGFASRPHVGAKECAPQIAGVRPAQSMSEVHIAADVLQAQEVLFQSAELDQ